MSLMRCAAFVMLCHVMYVFRARWAMARRVLPLEGACTPVGHRTWQLARRCFNAECTPSMGTHVQFTHLHQRQYTGLVPG